MLILVLWTALLWLQQWKAQTLLLMRLTVELVNSRLTLHPALKLNAHLLFIREATSTAGRTTDETFRRN
jgi:hypothetical protein